MLIATVTRSHKNNDRDHVGLANGTASPEEHLPRYFAKSGHVDIDPKSTKKNGSGKGNWGRQGDELADLQSYNPTNPRRRSNSFSAAAGHTGALKTKFETIEHEPVFEEEIHGPDAVDYVTYMDAAAAHDDDGSAAGLDLEKQSTLSSAGSGNSVEEDEVEKK